MASIQEKNRDETGESSRLGFQPVQGISFQSQSLASNENRGELQIPQRPCPKSQRKIVPTEKARRICDFCQKNFEGGLNSARDYQSHVGRCKKFHKFIVDENSTQCSLCPREFANQGNLLIHLEKAHSDKILEKECESKIVEKECEICLTTLLKKHWTIHWKTCQKYRGINYAGRDILLQQSRFAQF